MEDPGVNLADLTPEEREAYELKVQLQVKREDVCDTSLFNEAQSAQPVSVKIRRRRDLKGHLTKVHFVQPLNPHSFPQLCSKFIDAILISQTYLGSLC